MSKHLIFGEELNSLIIFDHDLSKDLITIEDEYRLAHLHQVLKVKPLQMLKVTVLNMGLAQAKVETISKNKIELKLTTAIKELDYPEWHLLVALSRPPTMKKILEHATSLGVSHFHFFAADLSEKSYGDSKIWQSEKSQKVLLDGLSQSACYWKLPTINHYKNMAELPLFEGYQRRLSSLSGSQKTKLNAIAPEKPLVLAFGPERGFTFEEDDALRARGFEAFSLGQGVLRVEIAVFSALGQCHLLI